MSAGQPYQACRGIRGATSVAANTSEDILEATDQLLRVLSELNHLDPDDIASAVFTTTPDLTRDSSVSDNCLSPAASSSLASRASTCTPATSRTSLPLPLAAPPPPAPAPLASFCFNSSTVRRARLSSS